MSQQRMRKGGVATELPRTRSSVVKAAGDSNPPNPNRHQQPRSRSINKIPKNLRYDLDNALVGLCDVWFEEIKPHLIRNNIKVHIHGDDANPASGDHQQVPPGAPGCSHYDPASSAPVCELCRLLFNAANSIESAVSQAASASNLAAAANPRITESNRNISPLSNIQVHRRAISCNLNLTIGVGLLSHIRAQFFLQRTSEDATGICGRLYLHVKQGKQINLFSISLEEDESNSSDNRQYTHVHKCHLRLMTESVPVKQVICSACPKCGLLKEYPIPIKLIVDKETQTNHIRRRKSSSGVTSKIPVSSSPVFDRCSGKTTLLPSRLKAGPQVTKTLLNGSLIKEAVKSNPQLKILFLSPMSSKFNSSVTLLATPKGKRKRKDARKKRPWR